MAETVNDIINRMQGIKLDIGCGANKQPSFVGMDVRPLPGVDIVHDWNVLPWPLPDECVIQVLASHVVEHVPPCAIGPDGRTRFPFVEWMNELWRVCRVDAEVAMSLPHGSSQGYLQDPTHCNPCNEATWAYFDPEHVSGLYNIYRPKPWYLKYINWAPNANIEVILVKRKEVVDGEETGV